MKDFLLAASVSIALVTSEYLMAIVEVLHTVVTRVSQEEGRLLMSIIGLSSSSIVVPCDVIWELKLSYSLSVPESNRSLSSSSCRGAGSNTFSLRRPSFRRFPTASSKVRRLSRKIAL